MFEYKLQVGCLIILLYFISNYIKDSISKKTPCSKLFVSMLVIVPWAIIFDGVTAYTVNHMDTVPSWINVSSHGIFFLLYGVLTIFVFLYMINQTLGIPNKLTAALLCIPGLLAIAITVFFMKDIYFIDGIKTNYSMGTAVYACFISLFIHYLVILFIILFRSGSVEKRKQFSLVLLMIITFGLLIAQVLLPEILLTSIAPTIMILGLYINYEDPSFRKIQTYDTEIVTGFATLVENRDNNTGNHVQRTREYVKILIDEMKKKPKYKNVMTKDYINNVTNAAPLHDIGKIGTPDYILQKPGRLTCEEYEIMKKHSVNGKEILEKILADLDNKEYLKIACEVACYHHERWNGQGYPEGLSGEQIPLHARIMAIADVFDAVSEKRCYRDAMTLDESFKIIEDGAGSDFDPELAMLFVNARERITKYHNEHK